MPDLRESISEAIDSLETAEVESVETAEVAEPASEAAAVAESDPEKPERDERGRFKGKQPDEGDPVAEQAAEVPPEPVAERKRPSSWKKELWDKYDSADPELQEYILQREDEARRGVGMYRQKAEFAEKIERELVPYQDLIQKMNGTPETVVRELMQAASILHTADRVTKAAFIQRLAVQHGLTSQDFDQAQQAGPTAINAQTELMQYKAELARMKAEQESQRTATIEQQIEDFRQTHPNFDALETEMSGLLQAGIARDLQDAYDKALRLNPQAMSAPQAPSQRDKATRAVQTARAAAVSPRSTTATMAAPTTADRREAILSAFEQHAPTSRV